MPTFTANERMSPEQIFLQVENVPAGLLTCAADRNLKGLARDVAIQAKYQSGRLFSAHDLAAWLEAVKTRLGALVQSVQDSVPPQTLVGVIRTLLIGGVPLSHPRGVFETLLREFANEKSPEELAEMARSAMRAQIPFGLINEAGVLPIITLAPAWIEALQRIADPVEGVAHRQARRLDRLAVAMKETWQRPRARRSLSRSS